MHPGGERECGDDRPGEQQHQRSGGQHSPQPPAAARGAGQVGSPSQRRRRAGDTADIWPLRCRSLAVQALKEVFREAGRGRARDRPRALAPGARETRRLADAEPRMAADPGWPVPGPPGPGSGNGHLGGSAGAGARGAPRGGAGAERSVAGGTDAEGSGAVGSGAEVPVRALGAEGTGARGPGAEGAGGGDGRAGGIVVPATGRAYPISVAATGCGSQFVPESTVPSSVRSWSGVGRMCGSLARQRSTRGRSCPGSRSVAGRSWATR